MKKLTPNQYVKAERAAGRFPNMPIEHIAGGHYLCDKDWNILDGRRYDTQDAAIKARSQILDRSRP